MEANFPRRAKWKEGEEIEVYLELSKNTGVLTRHVNNNHCSLHGRYLNFNTMAYKVRVDRPTTSLKSLPMAKARKTFSKEGKRRNRTSSFEMESCSVCAGVCRKHNLLLEGVWEWQVKKREKVCKPALYQPKLHTSMRNLGNVQVNNNYCAVVLGTQNDFAGGKKFIWRQQHHRRPQLGNKV